MGAGQRMFGRVVDFGRIEFSNDPPLLAEFDEAQSRQPAHDLLQAGDADSQEGSHASGVSFRIGRCALRHINNRAKRVQKILRLDRQHQRVGARLRAQFAHLSHALEFIS